MTYTSVISTVRCYAVTSGEKEGSTFVQWTGNFSSDADAGKPPILFNPCIAATLRLRLRFPTLELFPHQARRNSNACMTSLLTVS